MPFSSVYAVTCETEIDGTTTGATAVGMPTGQGLFHPLYVGVLVTEVSGLVTPPLISFGTNSSSYNNIISPTLPLALNAANEYRSFYVDGVVTIQPLDTEVYVRVATAAVATTYKFKVVVMGHFESYE